MLQVAFPHIVISFKTHIKPKITINKWRNVIQHMMCMLTFRRSMETTKSGSLEAWTPQQVANARKKVLHDYRMSNRLSATTKFAIRKILQVDNQSGSSTGREMKGYNNNHCVQNYRTLTSHKGLLHLSPGEPLGQFDEILGHWELCEKGPNTL